MKCLASVFLLPLAAFAGDWSKPAEIIVDDLVCATYRARVDGAGFLVVQLTLAEGWHSFAMDNQIRAKEKLAGKKALGMDRPTQFAVTGGLTVDGPWAQPPPLDFSKPELRIFSWGFEKHALFAAKAKRIGNEPRAHVAIKAQACTASICKNIDSALDLDLTGASGPADAALSGLTPVRSE